MQLIQPITNTARLTRGAMHALDRYIEITDEEKWTAFSGRHHVIWGSICLFIQKCAVIIEHAVTPTSSDNSYQTFYCRYTSNIDRRDDL